MCVFALKSPFVNFSIRKEDGPDSGAISVCFLFRIEQVSLALMNSPPATPRVHHYSYPPDHGMLINIHKIQFVWREREEWREWGRRPTDFDVMEHSDARKEGGSCRGSRSQIKKGRAVQNMNRDD